MYSISTVYHVIVAEGEQINPRKLQADGQSGRCKQSDAILRFIADPAVPFSNNIAERAVRMPKVKQKISGCFRTITGAENFCVIRSCLDMFRKQGHSMLEVLRRAFIGHPMLLAA